MNLRPVKHITDNLRDLTRWKRNRAAKELETKTMDTAMAYLREYRALLFHVDKLQRRLAQHDGCSRFSTEDRNLLNAELKVLD